MSLTKLWIHCVWSTKLRFPFLKRNLRILLFDHIIKNADTKSIEIIQIGGWEEHVHLLLKIHPSQNLSSIIHLIKGESSSWINKELHFSGSFAWQDSYYAESISIKDIKAVNNYIKNQEEHHTKITFLNEINGFKNSK